MVGEAYIISTCANPSCFYKFVVGSTTEFQYIDSYHRSENPNAMCVLERHIHNT